MTHEVSKLEDMHKMKLLSISFKIMHIPDKFLKLSKLYLRLSILRFMDTTPEIKAIPVQLTIKENCIDAENYLIQHDSIGIH